MSNNCSFNPSNNSPLSFRYYSFGFWICLLFVILDFGFPRHVRGETMESSNYRIRMGNFNMTSGVKTSASYSLTDTVGQTAAGLFTSAGYSVKAGFQYIYTLYDFSFTISKLTIDLGTLTPNSFATDSHTLTVSAPGQGYSVTAYETAKLKNANSDSIPDTSCDSGTCDESTAGVWTSTAATGFGYNMTGDDIPATFTDSTYFRPFPDFSLAETPATVMTTSIAGRDRTATVTYQANISPTQAAGDYETSIIYIATPVY